MPLRALCIPAMKVPKQEEKEVTVLDRKQSDNISIGITRLPPVENIKQHILNMKYSAFDKETITVST